MHAALTRLRDIPDDYGVRVVIGEALLPVFHPILLSHEPLPAYGMRFLATVLEHWPR